MFSAVSSLLRQVSKWKRTIGGLEENLWKCPVFDYNMCVFSPPWIVCSRSQETGQHRQFIRINTHNKSLGFQNTTFQSLPMTEQCISGLICIFVPGFPWGIPLCRNLLSIMSVVVKCVFDLRDLRVSSVEACGSSGVSCFMPASRLTVINVYGYLHEIHPESGVEREEKSVWRC